MNPRTVLILSVVLVAAAITTYVVTREESSGGGASIKQINQYEEGKPLYPDLSLDDTHEISFTIAGNPEWEGDKARSVTLKKITGTWTVAGDAPYPAEEAKVKKLLHGVADLRAEDPVAVTEKHREAYKVTDDKGNQVVFKDHQGKEQAAFFFAKDEIKKDSADQWASAEFSHVRRRGEKAIYSTPPVRTTPKPKDGAKEEIEPPRENLTALFSAGRQGWYLNGGKFTSEIAAEKVVSATLRFSGAKKSDDDADEVFLPDEFTVRKQDGADTWEMVGVPSTDLDTNVVTQIKSYTTRSMSFLEVSAPPQDPAAWGLDAPWFVIETEVEGETPPKKDGEEQKPAPRHTLKLEVGKKTERDGKQCYPVRRTPADKAAAAVAPQGGYVYWVEQWIINNLTYKRERWFKSTPAGELPSDNPIGKTIADGLQAPAGPRK